MTPLFSVALVEELPIILLSFYSVQNKQRPSLLFGVLYFLTRVVFHTVLIYKARAVFGLCLRRRARAAFVARRGVPRAGCVGTS